MNKNQINCELNFFMRDDSPTVQGAPATSIIFCADDFGMNRSIDRGILALATQGRLSAASCMPTGPTFADDAPALADLPIQKGLHLNLTEAQPGTGFFRPLPSLIRHCYLRQLDRAQLRAEIEAQCERFERAFGQPPDYIDGHQHVHQLPVVRDELMQVLARRYATRLPWLRSTRAPRGIRSFGDWVKARLIETLGAGSLLRQARRSGFVTSRRLLGVYDFSHQEHAYRERLDAWLKLASPGDVLMCHPAAGAEAGDPIGPQRTVEFAVLADPSLPALLAKRHACIAGAASPVRCAG